MFFLFSIQNGATSALPSKMDPQNTFIKKNKKKRNFLNRFFEKAFLVPITVVALNALHFG
jgi:hypothetical protein